MNGSHETSRAHLQRAGALIAERRLPEAETEIVRALELAPGDLRAQKLLALTRFKLGRLAEAREVLRTIVRAAPEDPAVHMNVGLIALKLDWFAEAATELEAAVRLAPESPRALSYLGYAYARLGRREEATAVFRRAGQNELATALARDDEGAARARGPEGDETAALLEALDAGRDGDFVEGRSPRRAGAWPGAGAAAGGDGFRPAADGFDGAVQSAARAPGASPPAAPPVHPLPATPPSAGEIAPPAALPLDAFALARLVPPRPAEAAGPAWVAQGVLHIGVSDVLFVRPSALLAAAGALAFHPARRRQHGRRIDEPLGGGEAFRRVVGTGELWLVPRAPGRSLTALTLADDVLYLREDSVTAFGEALVWEAGRLPRDGLALLQFRGTGQVLVDLSPDEVVAMRVEDERPLRVDRERILGWIGRVVAQGIAGDPAAGTLPSVACSGEGVLLILRHGHAAQPVHEPAEPRHDGAGAAGAGGALLHR